ncbi:MAG: DNA polymerase III subunit alpha, partial [Nannocystales bacterium]
IKRPDEMQPYFEQYPEAIENAALIAKACNVELKLGTPELPDFALPEGVESDLPGYLREVVLKGLVERLAELRARGFKPDEDLYRSRLDYELGIINSMQFPGYFLIVWDFIRHARKIGVPVGPGRGSGAGSLVAYSMRITDIDPIQYNLLFERFLNPERVSMPDFDIDFCMHRREEVISYVMDRYGHDHVGQIATFHSLKARGLVRDVCRVMGWSVQETNELAKLIPEGPKVTLSATMLDPAVMKKEIKADPKAAGKYKDALPIAEAAEKLRRRVADDAAGSPFRNASKVMKVGTSLEGLNRHAGMHAAGVVIGNRPLWEHVPCFKADGKIVTQYTMVDAENAGLVKFDFLGLKTLTVISNAVRLINDGKLQALAPWPPIERPTERTEEHPEAPHGPDRPLFDIDTIPLDDPDVYAMISRGDTTGVFQLESSGFKELLTRLKPDRFEDIIAAVALYRPGPLEGGMVDTFIECKHGRQRIVYPHDLLENVLRETYGVFVYQEQVMQAAQILAGFSLGAADMMRRAMGKKKKKEMDRQRGLFVEGCKKVNDIDEKTSNDIFDLIDKFAGYGFNKSHSAAYGLITYQTGYLKCHFRTAFMAALMTCDKDKNENVVKFIAEARSSGIGVLPPCVNESERDFSVVTRPHEDDDTVTEQWIRFGMGGVRNVGDNAVESILTARKQDGPFVSLFEMCRRVDIKKVNKRTIEGLLRSGGLDSVSDGHGRAQVMAVIENAVEQGQGAQRDRESGQVGLFAAIAEPDSVFVESYPDIDDWSAKERLLGEREALGFYLTGHPLDRFQQDVERFATSHVGKLHRGLDGQEVVLAGVICEFREIQTRSGKGPMCFFQLEDQYGRVEVIVFPKTYQRVDEESGMSLGDELQQAAEEPVLASGKIEVERSDEGDVKRYKLLADSVRLVADVRSERTKKVLLRLRADQLTDDKVLGLKQLVSDHSGPCTMELQVTVDGKFASRIVFGDEFGVTADESLMLSLDRMFGPGMATMR